MHIIITLFVARKIKEVSVKKQKKNSNHENISIAIVMSKITKSVINPLGGGGGYRETNKLAAKQQNQKQKP